MTTKIQTPKGLAPMFPNRCLYSGHPNPDGEASLVVHSGSALLSFLLPFLYLFGWRRVRVPVAKQYRGRFYLQVFSREAVVWLLVFLAIVFLAPEAHRPRILWKFETLVLAFAVVIPWAVWEALVPRRLSISASGDCLEFTFASREYADEFARLNAPQAKRVE